MPYLEISSAHILNDCLNCAALVEESFSVKINRVGLFFCIKDTKIMPYTANCDMSLKTRSMLTNSEQAASVSTLCLPQILKVDALRHITKIVKCVVAWIAVFVVNAVRWPRARADKPCQPMCRIWLGINTDRYFVFCSSRPSDRADQRVFGGFYLPPEYASLRIVIKKFSHLFYGKIASSHDALLRLIGQRPASVFSTERVLAL
jgi:hypothetical protein